jgi:hypothetical protein
MIMKKIGKELADLSRENEMKDVTSKNDRTTYIEYNLTYLSI